MKYLCKKYFKIANIEYFEGLYYDGILINDITEKSNAILINHLYFILSDDSVLEPKFKDYFYKNSEVRKLKIDKINEI